MAKPRAVWAALAIVYVVWGSTYLAIRYLVETVPPFIGAGGRYVIAGVLMAAILAAISGPARLRLRPREAASTALVGALLLFGGNGLVMVAEQSIPSGLAALCVAVVPLFVVVLRLVFRDRPPAATIVGVVIGFAGIATLVNPGGHAEVGVLTVLGAALSWSVGSFVSSRIPLPADAMISTTYEMLFGGILLLVAGAGRGELGGFSLGQVSTSSWIALGYLVVFGSLVAFTAYVWLLQAAPISTVATYAYVNPAVAVALGTIAGEAFTWRIAVGGAIVIAAVAIVVSTESRGRAAARRLAEATAAGHPQAPTASAGVAGPAVQCAPGARPRR